MSLLTDRVAVKDLREADIDRMFALMQGTFESCEEDIFRSDLEKKIGVFILRNQDVIQGFSTYDISIEQVGDKKVHIAYSGDTVVDPEHRGNHGLWGDFLKYFVLEHEHQHPMYWFLISSGPRTYRFLPLFFKEFVPKYDGENTQELQTILKATAQHRFGEEYNPDTGIITFAQGAQKLKREFADVPKNLKGNPHIDYFVRRNPDYSKGDELACLTELSLENCTSLAKRRLLGL